MKVQEKKFFAQSTAEKFPALLSRKTASEIIVFQHKTKRSNKIGNEFIWVFWY